MPTCAVFVDYVLSQTFLQSHQQHFKNNYSKNFSTANDKSLRQNRQFSVQARSNRHFSLLTLRLRVEKRVFRVSVMGFLQPTQLNTVSLLRAALHFSSQCYQATWSVTFILFSIAGIFVEIFKGLQMFCFVFVFFIFFSLLFCLNHRRGHSGVTLQVKEAGLTQFGDEVQKSNTSQTE